jgi:photosystem II stability/assembly factor-like uncharacterized protein
MRVIKFMMGLLILMAPLATAQDMQWQSMDGPYFVYDVTGISLGWDGTQMRAYMVASNLNERYIYRYNGSSPINGWIKPLDPVPGAKHISASRQHGLIAYATVPDQEGIQSGVQYTENGGGTWNFTLSQPGNKAFTCIETHPGNPEICFTGAELIGGDVASVWRTVDGGQNWADIKPEGINWRKTVNAIRIDPNSGNTIERTIIYVCYNSEGIWRGYNGGLGKWENISVSNNEQAIDIAVEYNLSNNLYLVATHDGSYQLWHSAVNGKKWQYVRDMGKLPIVGIAAAGRDGIENIWVSSKDTLYYCQSDSLRHSWFNLAANTGDTLQCLSIDYKNPHQAYVGSKHNIEWITYDGKTFRRESIVKGTNYNGPIKEEWK